MEIFFRIRVEKDFKQEGNVVSPYFVNVLKSMRNTPFLENEEGIVLGYTENGKMYELFTQRLIEVDFPYEKVDGKYINDKIAVLNVEAYKNYVSLIRQTLFGEQMVLNFYEATILENGRNRALQAIAYDNHDCDYSPYEAGHLNDYKRIIKKKMR